MRLITDTFAFCQTRGAALEHDLHQRLPHPRGRLRRRAGGRVHARRRHRLRRGGARRAGWRSTSFAPRLSFFFNAHNELPRGGRQVPRGAPAVGAHHARALRRAAIRRAQMLRFHAQTAGSTLTGAAAAEQRRAHDRRRRWPRCSAARSRCTPTATTRRWRCRPRRRRALALRTQQIIAHESGVADVVDPLGGSYAVEALTVEIEARAAALIAEIDALRRHGRRDRAGLPAARDRAPRATSTSAPSRAASASSSASTSSPTSRAAFRRRCTAPTPPWKPHRSRASRSCGRRRDGSKLRAALDALATAARRDRQPGPGDPGGRQGACHAGRDCGRVAQHVRGISAHVTVDPAGLTGSYRCSLFTCDASRFARS